jgi:hypothetical protein
MLPGSDFAALPSSIPHQPVPTTAIFNIFVPRQSAEGA